PLLLRQAARARPRHLPRRRRPHRRRRPRWRHPAHGERGAVAAGAPQGHAAQAGASRRRSHLHVDGPQRALMAIATEPASGAPYTATVLHRFADFLALEPEWRELHAAAERPFTWQRHRWLRLSWELVWRRPLNRLRI